MSNLIFMEIYGIINFYKVGRRYNNMYTLEALKRKISKEGLDNTLQYLLSENLPLYVKIALEEEGVFCDGSICIDLTTP